METKELEQKFTEIENSVKEAATKEAKAVAANQITEFETKYKDVLELKEFKELKEAFDKLKKDTELNQPIIDAFVRDSKKQKEAPLNGQKSFNDIIGETIEKNADKIRDFRPNGNGILRLELPEAKRDATGKLIEIKAVGDMSISGNFSAASALYQDVRNNLIETPYNKVWLSDILPSSTSTGTNVVYPKENGGEGAAAAWTDYTQDKAQIDFDLTSQTAYFKWIAGYVIVQRDMLDDIPFMLSYIQNRMLISLKTAENDVILNGTSDTNPIQGLADVATAYSGTFTKPVDRIIDAGWGQIVEDTNEFYSPTHVIMKPRDAVKIGLNKADGSQEYDLPAGSVAFVNGKLTVGGLTVVSTAQLSANTFYAIDNRALMFIRRIAPELKVIEDATLAKKNKIMFRIEERVTLVPFNNSAIVSGTLDASV